MKLLFLLVTAAHAQAPTASKVVSKHNGGLVTYFSSQRLQDDQTSDATNFLFDQDEAVVKRRGQSLYGAISGCSSPVRAGATLRKTDGSTIFIAACGTHLYKSTGDGTFSTIGSTISSSQPVRLVPTLGLMWMADGVDYLTSTDGTTVSSYTAAPIANLLDTYYSRLVEANVSGGLSTIWLSGQSNGSDFTIPSVIVATSAAQFFLNGPNDGRKVTCTFGGFKNVLILWNADAMYGLYGADNNSFVLRQLAEVGCDEQESVQEFEGKLRWLSRFGIYQYDGANLLRISDPIKDQINNIIATEASTLSILQTSQADWQGGNLTAAGAGAPMSATIIPGSVTPSTWSITENSGSQWSQGTLVGMSTSASSLSMSISSFAFSNGDFILANFNNWTTAGAWSFDSAGGDPTGCNSFYGNPGQATSPDDESRAAIPPCNTFPNGTQNSLIEVRDANGGAVLKSCTITYTCSGTIDCAASASTCQTSLIDGMYGLDTSTLTASSIYVRIYDATGSNYIQSSSSTRGQQVTWLDASAGAGTQCGNNTIRSRVKLCGNTNYVLSSSFTSTSYDTSLTTPTWGSLIATVSSSSLATASFTTQVKRNGGSFDSAVAATPGAQIASAAKENIKYNLLMDRANHASYYSTMTAVVSLVTLQAATTGTFITNCFNPGSSISAWGLFQSNTIASGGTVAFAVSTGTSCGDATNPKRTFTVQANNATVGVTTAPFLAVLTTFTFTQAITQQPQLLDITVNYQTGASRPAVATQIYDNRYWMAYTTNTFAGAYNQQTLVFDYQNHWAKLTNTNCASLWTYNRQLYCGAGDSTGNVVVEDQGLTDLGSSIETHFRTPDYDLNSGMNLKDLYDLMAEFQPVTDPATTSTMTVTYFVDAGTTPYTLGSIYLGQPESGLLWSTSRFGQGTSPAKVHTLSYKFSNTSNAPIRFYRSQVRYTPEDFP